MSALPEIVPSLVDHIKQTLVGLKMPRAIEIFDVIVRRLERGEITAIEAIDVLLAEELTLRENRRIKIALVMARLSTIKTLAGFDFSFQPSLERERVLRLGIEASACHLAVRLSFAAPIERGDSDPNRRQRLVQVGVERRGAARSGACSVQGDERGRLCRGVADRKALDAKLLHRVE